jgi:hypothetical protein
MTNLEDRFGAGERQRALLHAAEGVRRGRLRRWSCCWVCNRWMRVLSGVVDLGRSSGAVSIRVAVGVPAGEFGPAAPTTPGRCAGMQSARGAAPHVPERKWPARSSRARSASTHHRGSRSGAGWQSASDSMRGPPAILTPTVASADPPPAPGSRAHPGRSTHRTAGLHILAQPVFGGELADLWTTRLPFSLPLRDDGPIVQRAAAGRRVAAQLPGSPSVRRSRSAALREIAICRA